jgi:hypothetical protein
MHALLCHVVTQDPHTVRPWSLVFPQDEVGNPVVNPAGRYCVRLFWLVWLCLVLFTPFFEAHFFKGDWRRIYVDDLFPVDSEQRLLLPVSSISGELWPLIMSKALCKVLAASYELRSDLSELGDTSVLHALTGWLPEATPLTSRYAAVRPHPPPPLPLPGLALIHPAAYFVC